MEKNSNKGLKKLVLLLLLFVGLGASVTAGAYWASITAKNPTDATGDLTVNIGEGKEISFDTTLAFTNEYDGVLPLVPSGYVVPEVTTNRREITITASWTTAPTGGYTITSATGTLNAVINSSSIEGVSSEDIKAMFDFSITTGVTINIGESEDIVVTVVFTNEPADKALYDLVAKGTLTINITLSVVAGDVDDAVKD